MEMVEKSQQRLILRSRPWGLWLTGLICCLGAAVPIWFAARYELVCRHEVRVVDSRCRWMRSGATGVQITQIPLPRPQGLTLIPLTPKHIAGDSPFTESWLDAPKDIPARTSPGAFSALSARQRFSNIITFSRF